jgi:xylose isomerase
MLKFTFVLLNCLHLIHQKQITTKIKLLWNHTFILFTNARTAI